MQKLNQKKVLQELYLGERKSTTCSRSKLRKLTQGDPGARFFSVTVIPLLFLFSTDYRKWSSSESLLSSLYNPRHFNDPWNHRTSAPI